MSPLRTRLAPFRRISSLLRWLAWCLLAWLTARTLSEGVSLAWQLTHSASSAPPTYVLPQDAVPAAGTTLWTRSERTPDDTLPLSRLPLSIIGVVRGTPLSRSVLVLDTPQGQQVVSLGESIHDHVQLVEITRDGLILDNQGRHERLPWPAAPAADQYIVAMPPSAPGDTSRQPLAQAADTAADVTQRAVWPADAFHSRFGDKYRKQLLDNPAPLLRYFRAAPVVDGNHLVGYRLRPGADASLFDALPLESGDIVTAVEGHPISDGDTLALLRTHLREARLLRIQVQRNGRAITLELELSS